MVGEEEAIYVVEVLCYQLPYFYIIGVEIISWVHEVHLTPLQYQEVNPISSIRFSPKLYIPLLPIHG